MINKLGYLDYTRDVLTVSVLTDVLQTLINTAITCVLVSM